MKKLVGFTAAALAAVGVALAPAAMADPNDDAYLADLKAISGMNVQSPAHAIDSGHEICNDLVAGFGRQLIIDNTAKSGDPDLDPAQASGMVDVAQRHYCP